MISRSKFSIVSAAFLALTTMAALPTLAMAQQLQQRVVAPTPPVYNKRPDTMNMQKVGPTSNDSRFVKNGGLGTNKRTEIKGGIGQAHQDHNTVINPGRAAVTCRRGLSDC